MEVQGISVIVTGGGSGMGAATAKHLADLGANVAVIDVSQTAVEAVANEIGGLALVADVTDERGIIEALQTIQAKHGTPRVCINCAGIISAGRIVGRKGPMPLEAFNQVIQVNLIGSFNVMRLSLAAMQLLEPIGESQERGVVINTASIAAYEGQIGQVAYSASKGGVTGMILPVAREMAQFGIRVMGIAPGLIETPMLAGIAEASRQRLIDSTEFPKRLGKPEEFAATVAHIIQNPLLNGDTIRLDGAVRLQAK